MAKCLVCASVFLTWNGQKGSWAVTWPDGLKGCTSVSEGLHVQLASTCISLSCVELCWIVLKRFSSFVISCAIGLPRPSVNSWTEHWTGVASAQPLGWWRTLWIGSMFEGWNLRVQLCPCLHKNCCSAVFCHLFIFEFSNVEGAGERVQTGCETDVFYVSPGATLVRHGRMESHGLWQSVAWSSVNGSWWQLIAFASPLLSLS